MLAGMRSGVVAVQGYQGWLAGLVGLGREVVCRVMNGTVCYARTNAEQAENRKWHES